MATVTIDITIPRLFEAEINRVGERLMVNAAEGMDRGMKKVAALTRAHRETPWNKPGVYGNRWFGHSFQWEATGLAEESIQGYVVGKTYPQDLPPRTDRFGRVHSTNARRVAPVDHRLGSDTKIVGVLTMTASYAPAESQSPATDDSIFGGRRLGAQAHEGPPGVTVVGLKNEAPALVREIQAYLESTMRVA